MSEKMFDFAIGNPPYQGENDLNGRQPPVYHEFMDAVYDVADCVELITPARFLFNAGQTPRDWNQKMLDDTHFKILHYEPMAINVFPQTDIKGGVAISIHDINKDYGPIKVFAPHDELNSILLKINPCIEKKDFSALVSNRGMYRLTELLYQEHPEAKEKVGAGTGNMIVSNIFDKLPQVFTDEENTKNSYRILGRKNNNRVYKYVFKQYVTNNDYIDKYKVFFPEGNSSGKFGETLTAPEIGKPGDGATDTFLNIGPFETKEEAENTIKYISTKFLRALLGIKKATQHTPKKVWGTIPLQNFTATSDIDWSKSIAEIDQQLYQKYNLSPEEIDFIEKNVKEMA